MYHITQSKQICLLGNNRGKAGTGKGYKRSTERCNTGERKISAVKPRFKDASYQEQFSLPINFPKTKRLDDVLCLELRIRKPSTSWSDKLYQFRLYTKALFQGCFEVTSDKVNTKRLSDLFNSR
jgi:hypothetical protein